MISEYYEKFENTFSYQFLHPTLVREFEEYLYEHGVGLDDAYVCVDEYVDTRSISQRTKRNYRTRLRRLVEYAQKEAQK